MADTEGIIHRRKPGTSGLLTLAQTFLAVFHCVPIQKFWNTDLAGVCNIDDSRFFFGTVLTHLIIDIVILALPVIEVQKLRLPLSQRLGIMGMFMFGIFVCIASVVVLVYSIHYDTKSVEMPWNIAPIIIWATVEVNLAIVSGESSTLTAKPTILTRDCSMPSNASSDLAYHGTTPSDKELLGRFQIHPTLTLATCVPQNGDAYNNAQRFGRYGVRINTSVCQKRKGWLDQ